MVEFYDYYNNRPPKVNTVLTDDTCFVSQSECQNSSLKYVLDRFGMNTLTARMEEMRGKFGYADCTVSNDFATLQNRYVQAKTYFENLPSNIRRQFHDNPLEFYEDLSRNPKKALDEGYISKAKFEEITGSQLSEERVFSVGLENDNNGNYERLINQPLDKTGNYVYLSHEDSSGQPGVSFTSSDNAPSPFDNVNRNVSNTLLHSQSAPRSLD